MSVPGNLYTPTIRKTRGGDYLIEQSLLFDGSTTYLNRTPGTAGNRKTWTYSVWFKHVVDGSTANLFFGGVDLNNCTRIQFQNTGSINFRHLDAGVVTYQVATNGLYRDPSAWYHLVVAVDTTQATAADRVKIYINGIEQSYATTDYPAQNFDVDINSTAIHYIGRTFSTQEWDGHMALPILVDGAALDPTSFGEEDDDGYWNPIEFAGTATVSWTENLSIDDHASKPSTGTASASSEANASSAAEHAFNEVTSGGTNVGWQSSSAGSQWLQFQYDTAQTIKAYYVVGHVAAWSLANRAPNSWTIVGSNTGAFSGEEVTIDTVSGESGWSDQEVRWFDCSDNDTAYTYYRMNISSNNGGTLDSVIEWNMFGQNDTGTGFGTNGFALDFADTAAFGVDVKNNSNAQPTIVFEAGYTDDSNATTYTFSSADLGTADADRYIYVAVEGARATAGSRTVSTMTINGVSASFVVRQQSVNLNAHEFWYAAVPTGSTGDIVVTFNSSMHNAAIGVWSVTGSHSVIYSNGDNTVSGSAISTTFAGSENSVTLLSSYDAGSNISASWSPATEKYDSGNFDTAGLYTAAQYTNTSATNGTTQTVTFSGATSDVTLLGITISKTNDNSYVTNNFTADDQLSDTPTDSADDGFGNRPTLNPNDKSTSGTFTFSNGNRTVTQTGSDVKNAFCTMSLPTTGKIYFECYWSSVSGDPSMGITTTPIWTANDWKGAVNGIDTADADKWLWNGDNFFDETSSTSYSGFGPDAAAYEKWAIDLDTGKVWSGNSNNGWANSGDPAAGTGELATIGATELASGLVVFIRLRLSVVGTVNFGQVAFNETPPTGFSGWSTADFAAPTIADGSDYFNTVIYTGNGTSKSITGVGFQPDFVWIKKRDSTSSHILVNVIAGATERLSSDNTNAEATAGLDSFDSDGFTVGSGGPINTSGEGHVAWCWKAGGTAVTNSTFSITSQVSVNTTSGFSIVTYTAPASPSTVETVGHSLGAVPGMMIWKNRTDATDWYVWHKDLAANNNLKLNSTAAQTNNGVIVGDPPASASHFNTLGALHTANKDYVAYCWAEVEGFSKFGSYTGNGSTDGPFVYCGFRPAFLMIKRFDSTGSWHIYDKERLGYNPNNNVLYADTSGAEVSLAQDELLSNGFKMRNTGAARNASGGTYVFAAFAENPFQGDDGYTQGRAR